MNRSLLFLPAVLILLLAPAASAQILLRYSFPAGKELRYKKIESTQAQVTGPGGLEENIDRRSETLLRLTGEGGDPGTASYVYRQDTVMADEKLKRQLGFRLSDFNNALNRKRIRVRISDGGELRGIEILDPVSLPAGAPVQISDTVLAQQALLFPALPSRPVKAGESWTDARTDTLRPKFSVAGAGEGGGLTIQSSSTTYTGAGTETVDGYACVKITWRSTLKRESQMTVGEMEMYNEDESVITGSLHFADKEGIIVRYESRTVTDSANAIVSGGDTTQMPSTTTNEVTLSLISNR